MKHLFLCTEKRSGSTFFLSLLQLAPEKKRFGSFGEMLHNSRHLLNNKLISPLLGDRLESFCLNNASHHRNEDFDLSLYNTVIPAFYEQYGRGKPVLAKWFSDAFRILLDHLGHPTSQTQYPPPTVRNELEALFGEITYIYLYRKDLWRQAISFYIARRSDQWINWRDSPEVVNEETVPFNFPLLKSYHDAYGRRQIWWKRFFDKTGIEPALTLAYEDYTADYGRMLTQLGRVLDMELYVPPPDQLKVQKQEHPLKEAYYQRVMEILEQQKSK